MRYLIHEFFGSQEVVQGLNNQRLEFWKSFGILVFGKFVNDSDFVINLGGQVVSLDNLKDLNGGFFYFETICLRKINLKVVFKLKILCLRHHT